MQVTSSDGGPQVHPAGHSTASGEGSEGSGSRGSGCVPDCKQPGALGVSELFKNKRNPLPALRRDKFSFQKLLFGMFNVFHQNHKAVLFSSHFCDVFNG